MSSLGTPKWASRAIRSLNSSYLVVSLLANFSKFFKIYARKHFVFSNEKNSDCCQRRRWCQAGARSWRLGLLHRRRGAEYARIFGQVSDSTRHCQRLGSDGEVLGAVHIFKYLKCEPEDHFFLLVSSFIQQDFSSTTTKNPRVNLKREYIYLDRASFEYAGKPWIHCWDYVWVVQRSRSLHSSTSEFDDLNILLFRFNIFFANLIYRLSIF